MRQQQEAGSHVSDSFLRWHRTRQYDTGTDSVQPRGGRHQQTYTATLVVACRYWFELTDGYWGQFTLTQIPHLQAADILPKTWKHLECMKNLAGALEYLSNWRWHAEPGVVQTSTGCTFLIDALPLLVDAVGDLSGFLCAI